MKKTLMGILLISFIVLSSFAFLDLPGVNAYDEDFLYKVRQAIIYGQQFLNRLYKPINDGDWGVFAEYVTQNPIGIIVQETDSAHACGDGDMQGNDDNDPSLWYRYFDLTGEPPVYPWTYIEPNTKDICYIMDGGFEDEDRDDPITGNNYAEDDCNEPLITAEFENDHLIKNPSVEFRKYNEEDVDDDDPWDWYPIESGSAIARMGYHATGSPNQQNGKGSHTGFYNLHLEPKGYYCSWEQIIEDLDPNTEYYFSFAFKGKVPYPGTYYARVEIDWRTSSGSLIKQDTVNLPYGTWNSWQHVWEDWTSPSNTAKANFRLKIKGSSTYWLDLDTFYAIEKTIVDSCWVNANYEVRTSFQVYDYMGSRTVDMYLDGDLVEEDVCEDYLEEVIPRPYFSKASEGFAGMRTALRHELVGNWYYQFSDDSSQWDDRMEPMEDLRDYYDVWGSATFPAYDFYEPMYIVSDSWMDSWMWNRRYIGTSPMGLYEYSVIYDYKLGDTDYQYEEGGYDEPPFRDVNHAPYRSKVLLNVEFFMEGFDPPPSLPFPDLGHCFHPLTLSMVALQHLLKHNSATHSFNYWGKGTATPAGLVLGPSYGSSPVGYVLDYWTDDGILFPDWTDVYTIVNQACALAVLSILGYGYNYAVARTKADALAEIICNVQWGNPDSTGHPEGFGKHEDWGWCYRPDNTGGFYICYSPGSGYEVPAGGFIWDLLVDFFWGMPKETFLFVPCTQEGQFALRALQIYDYYKFKKDGGTSNGEFKRLLISEDVNADGSVNILDISAVSSKNGKERGDPGWNALYDLNLDEIINTIDIAMVGINNGRSSSI